MWRQKSWERSGFIYSNPLVHILIGNFLFFQFIIILQKLNLSMPFIKRWQQRGCFQEDTYVEFLIRPKSILFLFHCPYFPITSSLFFNVANERRWCYDRSNYFNYLLLSFISLYIREIVQGGKTCSATYFHFLLC